jgi:hypothetical protein
MVNNIIIVETQLFIYLGAKRFWLLLETVRYIVLVYLSLGIPKTWVSVAAKHVL